MIVVVDDDVNAVDVFVAAARVIIVVGFTTIVGIP